jgi:uncharacterized protein (DUF1684 family)
MRLDKATTARLVKEGRLPAHTGDRPSKYRNVVTTENGERFDSRREARRWAELKIREREGTVTDLRRQVPYELAVNGTPVTRYVADFVYRDEHGRTVVEDAKGFATPVYRLKAKLMRAVYGIEIVEV